MTTENKMCQKCSKFQEAEKCVTMFEKTFCSVKCAEKFAIGLIQTAREHGAI